MIILPSTNLQIDLSNNICTLELLPCYSTISKQQLFPSGYDIEGITFQNLDKNIIESATIYIGDGLEFKYENDELNNIELPEGGILASRILQHKFGIQFKIKDEYVQTMSRYVQVDEYEEIEEVGDELMMFKTKDGTIYEGYPRKSIRRPTGKKVNILNETPTVHTPIIEFKVKKNDDTCLDTLYTTVYWQTFTIDPTLFPKSYIERVRNQYCFTPDDTTIDIDTYIENKTPITGKIKVVVSYRGGYVFKH
jgi:hypothetical protein